MVQISEKPAKRGYPIAQNSPNLLMGNTSVLNVEPGAGLQLIFSQLARIPSHFGSVLRWCLPQDPTSGPVGQQMRVHGAADTALP